MYVHELLESDDHSSYQENISTQKGRKTQPTAKIQKHIGVGFTKKGKCPMFAEDIGTKAR